MIPTYQRENDSCVLINTLSSRMDPGDAWDIDEENRKNRNAINIAQREARDICTVHNMWAPEIIQTNKELLHKMYSEEHSFLVLGVY